MNWVIDFVTTSFVGNIILVILGVLFACFALGSYKERTSSQMLDIIETARKNGCFVPAKMTCLLKRGKNGKAKYYEAEYMYMVDNQQHFITYKIDAGVPLNANKGERDPSELAYTILPSLMVYYDKKNPENAITKLEVFVPTNMFGKINTPENNKFRNVYCEWDAPIDLT